jgi:hypothetical protein
MVYKVLIIVYVFFFITDVYTYNICLAIGDIAVIIAYLSAISERNKNRL